MTIPIEKVLFHHSTSLASVEGEKEHIVRGSNHTGRIENFVKNQFNRELL